ncbi:MAG: helix-turn-helix domain-containing protein [Oscillospiraceae bacterium]|nr:helix-turn-helix domain-containing protein [Oscillospiraceae bacterium]
MGCVTRPGGASGSDADGSGKKRSQLEALLKAKVQVSRIARQLGFCRQTIYNEMKRGAYVHTCDYWDEKRYSADKAQQLHDYNQTAKGRPLKIGNDRAYAMFLGEQ